MMIYTYNWIVGRGHANAGLVARRNAIDPELVKVLVGCCESSKRSSEDNVG